MGNDKREFFVRIWIDERDYEDFHRDDYGNGTLTEAEAIKCAADATYSGQKAEVVHWA